MMKMCLPTIYRIISNNHSKSFGKTQKCNLFTCHLKLIAATHTYRNQEMYMEGYIHKIYMYIGIYLKNEENIKINQDEELCILLLSLLIFFIHLCILTARACTDPVCIPFE